MSGNESTEDLRRITEEALRAHRHHLVHGDVPPPDGYELLFLGTGGNPTNVVGQWRQTGGFLLTVPGCRLFVDPGPGAVFHAARAGVDMRGLSALFISHRHTDHFEGAGAVIEAMCRGMTATRGLLVAPEAVLREVSPFYRGEARSRWYPGGPSSVRPLRAGESIPLGPGVRLTATPAHHADANIGFRLDGQGGGLSVGYTSDTAFVRSYRTPAGIREVRPGEGLPADFIEAADVFDDMVQAYAGLDALVMNVSFFHQHAHRHLTVLGAAELLKRTRPRRAVLTHFDPSLGVPEGVARRAAALVREMTGIPTEAARDGMRLDLRGPW